MVIGKVNPDSVTKFVSRTCYQDVEDLIEYYTECNTWYHELTWNLWQKIEEPDKATMKTLAPKLNKIVILVRDFDQKGLIFQPRLSTKPRYPLIDKSHWVNNIEDIEWSEFE
jgi:hypothetical protein